MAIFAAFLAGVGIGAVVWRVLGNKTKPTMGLITRTAFDHKTGLLYTLILSSGVVILIAENNSDPNALALSFVLGFMVFVFSWLDAAL